MASKISINLDTSKEFFLNSKCKQNDDLILEANIFENGLTKDLTNCSISIQALKADKTYVIQNTDITKSNNKFIAHLVKDFTRIAGKTEIEVVLTESSKQNTTFSFCIEVVGSVIRGAVQSSNTVTILENLQDKIEEAGQVKAETEQLIEKGGAATKGDIEKVNSSLEQINKKQKNLKYINILDFGAKGDANFKKNGLYYKDRNCTILANSDKNAFTNALNYINMNEGYFTLLIPNGNYLLDDLQIILDESKFNIIGGFLSKLISKGLTLNQNFITITNKFGSTHFDNTTPWDYMKKSLINIRLEGNYLQKNDASNSGICGLAFSRGESFVDTPHTCTHNVTVQGFNYGLYSGKGCFKQVFNECCFIGNDVGLFFDNANGYGGIPITFNNCMIECNILGIRQQTSGTGEIIFNGGSIEYNGRVCEIYDNVIFRDLHIEMDIRMANDNPFKILGDRALTCLTIDNSWILLHDKGRENSSIWIPNATYYDKPQYLFECINATFTGGYMLNINNTQISYSTNEQIPSSGEIVGGTGVYNTNIKLKHTFSYDSDNIFVSKQLNKWFNGTMERLNTGVKELDFFNIFLTNKTGTQTSADGTGTNLLLKYTSDGSSGTLLAIEKTKGSTNAEVSFFVPLVGNENGFIISFDGKPSRALSGLKWRVTEGVFNKSSYYIPGTNLNVLIEKDLNVTETMKTHRTIIKKCRPSSNGIIITIKLNYEDGYDFAYYVDNLIINSY